VKRTAVAAALALAGAAAVVSGLLRPRGGETRLLWWRGRSVSWPESGRGVVWTAEGELLRVGAGLALERLPTLPAGRSVVDAAARGDSIWLVDGSGALWLRNADGSLTGAGRTPFDIPTLAPGPLGVWVARSPIQFTFRPETTRTALLLRLGKDLVARAAADTAVQPSNPFLAQLANAGHVLALRDGGAVFAPFIRDEVIRYDSGGAVRWRALRGLRHGTDDPRMLVDSGRVLLDYAPVNLGLSQDGAGRIYVLSTPRATTAESRLDVLDRETGRVMATRHFRTALPTIAVDARGTITTPDPDSLLAPAGEPVREAFPAFDLADPSGGRTRLLEHRGRVSLVNFWASWCAPCREELPALDSLRRTFDSTRVSFLALSDDVSEAAARRFLAEVTLGMQVGLGGGRLKGRYHYVGLPYTVLLDTSGRVVRRWSGYTGPRQIETISALIKDELARDARRPEPPAHQPRTSPGH
jgi:thiol-disulfide isomerase/thioredoxin